MNCMIRHLTHWQQSPKLFSSSLIQDTVSLSASKTRAIKVLFFILFFFTRSTIVRLSPFNPSASVRTVFHIMSFDRHLIWICYTPLETRHPFHRNRIGSKIHMNHSWSAVSHLSDNHQYHYLLIKAVTIPLHALVSIPMALRSAVSHLPNNHYCLYRNRRCHHLNMLLSPSPAPLRAAPLVAHDTVEILLSKA